MIIYQTLCSMFPLETLRSEKIAPLPVTDFIQRILVPETAIALVREDMGTDEEEALKTLRDSSSYGAAMFPVTDKEGAEDEVHDKLLKERARAKRKEIEETERLQGSSTGGPSASKQSKRKVDSSSKQAKITARPTRRKKGSVDEDSVVVDLSDCTLEGSQRNNRSAKALKKTESESKLIRSSSQTSQSSIPSTTPCTSSAANLQTPRP